MALLCLYTERCHDACIRLLLVNHWMGHYVVSLEMVLRSKQALGVGIRHRHLHHVCTAHLFGLGLVCVVDVDRLRTAVVHDDVRVLSSVRISMDVHVLDVIAWSMSERLDR